MSIQPVATMKQLGTDHGFSLMAQIRECLLSLDAEKLAQVDEGGSETVGCDVWLLWRM